MAIYPANVKGRVKILAVVMTITMAIIIFRLFDLQVLSHDHYESLAQKEQVKKLVIPAKRGRIYALDGKDPVSLVMNKEVFTVFADPTIVRSPDKIEKALQNIAGGELVNGDIHKLLTDQTTMYNVLARDVSLRQAEMIKKHHFKGIGFQKVSKRVYPEGNLAAQVLGFVNHKGQGQYGVEEALNSRLKGKDGILKSVTDVADVPLSIGDSNIKKAPVDGDNVVLTIDRNIQAKAEEALAKGLKDTHADNGSVLVMDPNDGHILAMANLPSYDPSKYWEVSDGHDFVNDTVSLPYEPGSVIKTLTVAMGIDSGTIEPNSRFYNDNHIEVGGYDISNVRKDITGNITMQDALDYSLNTGMVTIARRMGDGKHITRSARDKIYDYFYNKFHLGQLTGIKQAGERAGVVISPEDKKGRPIRYSNMVFGQGMDITMVQVSAAFSSLVNGGKYFTPSLVAGTYDEDSGTLKPENHSKYIGRSLSESAAKKAKEMVYKARQSYTDADTKGYYVGGKTGTSQTLENSHYVDNQTVATYLGFGGGSEKSSKYVIMVRVAGKGMNLMGNTDAMPIFTDISNWMLNYLQIEPKE